MRGPPAGAPEWMSRLASQRGEGELPGANQPPGKAGRSGSLGPGGGLDCRGRRWVSTLIPRFCARALRCLQAGLRGGLLVQGARILSVVRDAELLVIGGNFTAVVDTTANCIAAWNPATGAWSSLGTGCNATVADLAVLPSGVLVAAGEFWSAGGITTNYIAQWDGTSWSALGAGLSGPASCLAVEPSGKPAGRRLLPRMRARLPPAGWPVGTGLPGRLWATGRRAFPTTSPCCRMATS
jgi:hypothetical protein